MKSLIYCKSKKASKVKMTSHENEYNQQSVAWYTFFKTPCMSLKFKIDI